jgi:PAS domain S-box-containing protein/putative nucleotidyltransferase with HDIG domain
MTGHLHVPPMRPLRQWPMLGARATIAIALALFLVVLAVRVADSNAADGEGVFFILPIGLLALRFGLRGGIAGASVATGLVLAWGLLDPGVHFLLTAYVSRTLAFFTLGLLLGGFVHHRRLLEEEVLRYYDASLDLLASSDIDGRFTRVNPAWKRTLGYSVEEMCSRPLMDFVHPDDREATAREMQTLTTGGNTVGFRNRYLAADGSYRWLEWSASPSSSEGLIHAIARDVTVQHEAEQQLATNAKSLETMVAERTCELDDARAETLRRLATAAEYRDDETYQHTQRVGITAADIAEELSLGAPQVRLLRQAAPLHDVGKLAIPDRILLKPGKLTKHEYEVMKTHAELGCRMLSGSNAPVLQMAAVIAASHHERWDGHGYPNGLSGDAIPLVGRLVAVADVFDALTHVRPYKPAWPVEEALEEIRRCAGSQFDPRVVEAFLARQQRTARDLPERESEMRTLGIPLQASTSAASGLASRRMRHVEVR